MTAPIGRARPDENEGASTIRQWPERGVTGGRSDGPMKVTVHCDRCDTDSEILSLLVGDEMKLPTGWITAKKPMDPPGQGVLDGMVLCGYCRSKLSEWWRSKI